MKPAGLYPRLCLQPPSGHAYNPPHCIRCTCAPARATQLTQAFESRNACRCSLQPKTTLRHPTPISFATWRTHRAKPCCAKTEPSLDPN